MSSSFVLQGFFFPHCLCVCACVHMHIEGRDVFLVSLPSSDGITEVITVPGSLHRCQRPN